MSFFFNIEDITCVKNLTKKVLSNNIETTILNDISFSIKKKEILGVIGFSGAGKSTLLKCISGLTNFDLGEIFFNQDELKNFNTKAVIFQHFKLFNSKTALENVAFPLEIKGNSSKKFIQEKAKHYLNLVGMLHKFDCYPNILSGGEKQRIAIARALACESKLIFCDEITSALDPITTEEIIDLILNLNQKLGLSFLFVTHDISVMKKLCHRTLVMDKGEIIEEGTIEELLLFSKSEVTKKLLGLEEKGILTAYYSDKKNVEILRLSFNKNLALSPIISFLSKNSNIVFNILKGDIDCLRKETFGFLTIAIEGDKLDRDKAKEFLKRENVIIYEYSSRY